MALATLAISVIGMFSCDNKIERPQALTTKGGCKVDTHCRAPLRCIQHECKEPPAMTGEVSTDTPHVIFDSAKFDDVSVFIELAVTDEEMKRGLMFRDSMAPNWGMLFVYDSEEFHSFWMKNTLIPLDMIFISSDLHIVGIVEDAEPLTTNSRFVDGVSQFVLEVNGGFCRKMGIKAGSKLSFQHVLLDRPKP